jgi:cytochrome c5
MRSLHLSKIVPDQIVRRASLGLALIMTCAALTPGNTVAQTQSATPVKKTATQANTATAAVVQDPGERKFQANCSRCHTAPEQISPRIAGTVVRHMRVRASLSAQDERDILRYLAP